MNTPSPTPGKRNPNRRSKANLGSPTSKPSISIPRILEVDEDFEQNPTEPSMMLSK